MVGKEVLLPENGPRYIQSKEALKQEVWRKKLLSSDIKAT